MNEQRMTGLRMKAVLAAVVMSCVSFPAMGDTRTDLRTAQAQNNLLAALVKRLQAQVAALKAENAQLQKKLAATAKPTKTPGKPTRTAKTPPKAVANACPLKLVKAFIDSNVIGQPEPGVVVTNISTQPVVAYRVSVFCYDRFDQPVKHAMGRDNEFRGISQTTIAPGASEESKWTLHFRDTTAKILVVLNQVRLKDGTIWKPKAGQSVSIKGESSR